MPRSVRKYSLETIEAESKKTDIYLVTTPSGKIYVGKTYRAKYTDKRQEMMGAEKRWIAHKNTALYKKKIGKEEEGCRLLNQEILKYIDRLNDFKVEILEVCDRSEEKVHEKKWIAQLKSQHSINPQGLNIFEGGNGGTIQPEETRKRKAVSMILSHQNRKPDAYNKYRSDEARKHAAECQKANRICIHHDNITKLPYEIQFKYWPGNPNKNSQLQVGYWITTATEGSVKKATTRKDFTLGLLDQKFQEALDVFCTNYPERKIEVQHLYGKTTEGKYIIDDLIKEWYTAPSKKEGEQPKNRNKNEEYIESKKNFDLIKKSHTNKIDHNGNKLPLGISPIGRKIITGYKVSWHPLLKDIDFKNKDLDNACQMAMDYVSTICEDNFRNAPLITYDVHFNKLCMNESMLQKFVEVKNFEVKIFKP